MEDVSCSTLDVDGIDDEKEFERLSKENAKLRLMVSNLERKIQELSKYEGKSDNQQYK